MIRLTVCVFGNRGHSVFSVWFHEPAAQLVLLSHSDVSSMLQGCVTSAELPQL